MTISQLWDMRIKKNRWRLRRKKDLSNSEGNNNLRATKHISSKNKKCKMGKSNWKVNKMNSKKNNLGKEMKIKTWRMEIMRNSTKSKLLVKKDRKERRMVIMMMQTAMLLH